MLNKKKIAICIPVHKDKLTIAEINNIRITSKTNQQISKFFILPRSIKVDFFKKAPLASGFAWSVFNFLNYKLDGL